MTMTTWRHRGAPVAATDPLGVLEFDRGAVELGGTDTAIECPDGEPETRGGPVELHAPATNIAAHAVRAPARHRLIGRTLEQLAETERRQAMIAHRETRDSPDAQGQAVKQPSIPLYQADHRAGLAEAAPRSPSQVTTLFWRVVCELAASSAVPSA